MNGFTLRSFYESSILFGPVLTQYRHPRKLRIYFPDPMGLARELTPRFEDPVE